MSYDLCVVVPTLNESESIVLLNEKLRETLVGVRYEMIVVDDDSPDGTSTVVRDLAQQYSNVRVLQRIGRRGLASACIEGMLATSATYIAVMDGDLQHDETILPEMFRLITSKDLELVVASRNVEGGDMGEFAKWRVQLSQMGRKLSGVDRRAALTDPMSGFFVVQRTFFERIAHELTAVGFKILLDIVLSSDQPIRTGEVPYRFRARLHGESKLDLVVGLEYIELLLDKAFGGYVPVRFVLFCLVGCVGVGVHLGLLGLAMKVYGMRFEPAQAMATGVVMVLNYIANNSLTYRDRRRKGLAFWTGMLTFCIACALGAVANLAIADDAFRLGMPWWVAGFTGHIFSAIWNYGVTSIFTWREAIRSDMRREQKRQAMGERVREASQPPVA